MSVVGVVVVVVAFVNVAAVDLACNDLKRIEETIELQRRRPWRLLVNRDSSDLNATAVAVASLEYFVFAAT